LRRRVGLCRGVRFLVICGMCGLLWSCGIQHYFPSRVVSPVASRERTGPVAVKLPGRDQTMRTESSDRSGLREVSSGEARDMSLTERVVTEEELLKLGNKDPDLSLEVCREILARVNSKARLHVREAIRKGQPLKAPVDFNSYKGWTPLPAAVTDLSKFSKSILVVKDIAFLGWYERGRLVGDTQVSVGMGQDWTKAGFYKIEEKDANHYSRSYSNVYGRPAWMPWAMRIYETVWIHAGDVAEGHCSRGCVYLPLGPAEELYSWAEAGTVVMVVESLRDLARAMERGSGSG